MAEVPAGLLAGQNVGDEQPLVDLDAVLVALVESCFRRHLLSRRHEARERGGGVVDEILDAHECGSPLCQAIVDPRAVRGEEAVA